MKNRILSRLFTLLLTVGGFTETQLHADPAPAITSTVQANTTNVFKIKGMHCDGCAKGIQAELKLLPGIASAQVDFAKKSAQVAYDTNRVDQARLIKTIRDAGYEAVPVRARKGLRP